MSDYVVVTSTSNTVTVVNQPTNIVVGDSAMRGAPGPSGPQGALTPWAIKTSNYTAINGDRLIANTTTGAGSFTITLPASPVSGDYVVISDGGNWGANNLTVARNGSTIEGVADDILLNLKGVTVEFIYNQTTWEVTATTGARGPSGATQNLQSISGHVIPSEAITYDLGSAEKPWRDLYLSEDTIYFNSRGIGSG
jgi:hypothetical protein